MPATITTKRGDQGQTDLMFGKRVAKTHPQVEANGAVDELNAALGLVQVQADAPAELLSKLRRVQTELVGLMGMLATDAADLPRYAKAGYAMLKEENTALLHEEILAWEAVQAAVPRTWSFPGQGGSASAAFLDHARTICRRAERNVSSLRTESEAQAQPLILRYLNRLSDWLWLAARSAESGKQR